MDSGNENIFTRLFAEAKVTRNEKLLIEGPIKRENLARAEISARLAVLKLSESFYPG